MSDRRIDEATPDTNVLGDELVPVSDGGFPKCMKINDIKDFVLSKISEIDDAEGFNIEEDGVYVKKDGTLKKVSAKDLASAVVSSAFDGDGYEELFETDEIVIKRGETVRKATVKTLSSLISEMITPPSVDIESLPDAEELDFGSFIKSQPNEEGYENVKVGLLQIAEKVFSLLGTSSIVDESVEPVGDDDFILISKYTEDGYVPKLVKRKDTGFGAGNVNGPSASVSGTIPVFDGTKGDLIKNGYSVTESVGQSSSSTELPTAAAVNAAIDNATDDVVKYTGDINSGHIPVFTSGETAVIKDGYSVKSVVQDNPLLEPEFAIPTARALSTAISVMLRKDNVSELKDDAVLISVAGRAKSSKKITDTINQDVSLVDSKIATDFSVVSYINSIIESLVEKYSVCVKVPNLAFLTENFMSNHPNCKIAILDDMPGYIAFYMGTRGWVAQRLVPES